MQLVKYTWPSKSNTCKLITRQQVNKSCAKCHVHWSCASQLFTSAVPLKLCLKFVFYQHVQRCTTCTRTHCTHTSHNAVI